MKKYPFKFLDAYSKEDREIYFGRDEEVSELYRLVFQTNLLLVYGASGTGKTSLIRCGLANCFQPSQWLDLYVRRGSDINASLLDTIRNRQPEAYSTSMITEGQENDWFSSMMESDQAPGATNPKTEEIQSDHPVAHALHDLYLATFTPIFLIFDQFEELYTLGNPEEQKQFTQTITELVELALPVRIILVMREEYLANLYDLEYAIPQLRNKKLRVGPMNLPVARQVILSATTQNLSSNVQLEEGKEEEIIELTLEKIREGDVNIKLPYLQLFMDALYVKATGEPTDRTKEVEFSLEQVRQMGTIGVVLADFINQQCDQIYRELSPKYKDLPTDIVWQILSPFATMDGLKVPIKQDELHRVAASLHLSDADQAEKLIKETISRLENGRILRYRKEEQTYEVVHDTLAQQIADKRTEEEKTYLKVRRMVTEGYASYQTTKTLLSKNQLAFIQPYIERLENELSPEQKNFVSRSSTFRFRQQIGLWSGIAAVFLVGLVVIFTVLDEQQKTRTALATSETRRLASLATNLAKEHRFTDALHVGLAAYKYTDPIPVEALQAIPGIFEEGLDQTIPIVVKDLDQHTGAVRSAIFSPDGQTIMTLSADTTVKLWTLDGQLLADLNKHSDWIRNSIFSSDGKLVLTYSQDGTAKLWDLEGLLLADIKQHTSGISTACFSPNGKYILTGSNDNTAKLWDLEGGLLADLNLHGALISSASFSPDGERILTSSWDGTVKLWDLNGKLILDIIQNNQDSRRINTACFSPDGQHILTGSDDNTAKLWDLNGRLLANMDKHFDGVSAVRFSPDGKQILTLSDDYTANIWDLKGNLLATLDQHTVVSVKVSPNGRQILTNSDAGTAKLWDFEGKLLADLKQHTSGIVVSSFSQDGQYILTGSYDNSAKLWGLDGRLLADLNQHMGAITSASFSPDGKYILTSSFDETAKLWSLKNYLLANLNVGAHDAFFSPNGQQILTFSFDTIALWDARGQELATFNQHKNEANYGGFSPDGTKLLTYSDDITAKLWDINGQLVANLDKHEFSVNSACFSPDGQLILTSSDDKTAKLWDLHGNVLADLNKHTNDVISAKFSPDGRYILTNSYDKKVKLWDLKGNFLVDLDHDPDYVDYDIFSPDGQFILTSSADTPKLWDLKGNLLTILRVHHDEISSLSFSPDGKQILTGSLDGKAKLLDLSGPIQVDINSNSSQVHLAAFSPDGQTILTSLPDNTVKLWDLNGQLIAILNQNSSGLYTTCFSPDSQYVLTSNSNGDAKLWNLAGQLLADLNQQGSAVISAIFSPNGQLILTRTRNGTVKLWPAPAYYETWIENMGLAPLSEAKKREYGME